MCCPLSCASRLRNQFASQYCSRHRLSCGSGTDNGTSPQLSGSPANLPAHSRRRNWNLVLFVPAEDELAHKTSQPLVTVGRTSGSPSFATIAVRPRTPGWPKPKVEEETLCKTEVSCGPRVCAVPMFGNLDGERQELMASGNIEGW